MNIQLVAQRCTLPSGYGLRKKTALQRLAEGLRRDVVPIFQANCSINVLNVMV
jgi:hypothetical protein